MAAPEKQYPDHVRLVDNIHQRMNWKPGSFRLYRSSIKYPVLGLWYSIQFPLPSAP